MAESVCPPDRFHGLRPRSALPDHSPGRRHRRDDRRHDGLHAIEINAQGAKNLAIVCSEFDTILIQISTDFVFDGEKTEPYVETDVANPISVYGASKLQGEVEIKKIVKKHFIIRTSWLYSEHGNNFMKYSTMIHPFARENSLTSVKTM